jgi:hypothetical protein
MYRQVTDLPRIRVAEPFAADASKFDGSPRGESSMSLPSLGCYFEAAPTRSRYSEDLLALPHGRASDTKTRPDNWYQAEPCGLKIDPVAIAPGTDSYAVNEDPQPQLPVAFGLVKVKPDPITLVT